MALESLENRIDVTHLAIDQPEKVRLEFDAAREVSDQDWADWTGEFSRINQKENTRHQADLAVGMKLLRPEKYQPSWLPEGVVDNMMEYLTEAQGKGDWDAYSGILADLKIILPDVVAKHAVSGALDAETYDKIGESLDLARGMEQWERFLQRSKEWKILFGESPPLAYNDQQKIKDYYEQLRNGEEWYMIALVAADIKLSYPELFDDLGFGAEWAGIRKGLAAHRKMYNHLSVVDILQSMKILAADKIEVTPQGLKFINEPHLTSEQTKNLPEQRKF